MGIINNSTEKISEYLIFLTPPPDFALKLKCKKKKIGRFPRIIFFLYLHFCESGWTYFHHQLYVNFLNTMNLSQLLDVCILFALMIFYIQCLFIYTNEFVFCLFFCYCLMSIIYTSTACYADYFKLHSL